MRLVSFLEFPPLFLLFLSSTICLHSLHCCVHHKDSFCLSNTSVCTRSPFQDPAHSLVTFLSSPIGALCSQRRAVGNDRLGCKPRLFYIILCFSSHLLCLSHASCWSLFFEAEDGGSMYLKNIGWPSLDS
jgi:hypothetical protein